MKKNINIRTKLFLLKTMFLIGIGWFNPNYVNAGLPEVFLNKYEMKLCSISRHEIHTGSDILKLKNDVATRFGEDQNTIFHYFAIYTPHNSSSIDLFNELLSHLDGSEKQVINYKNKEGHTPADYAIHFGNEEILVSLLNNGVDVNSICNNMGHTLLHSAVDSMGKRSRVRKIVELLIGRGASVNCIDNSGKTPLHVLASNSNFDDPMVAELLINNSANIDSRDSHGRTPLWHAASWGNKEVVKTLLAHGAAAYIDDYEGVSPLQIARKEEKGEVGKMEGRKQRYEETIELLKPLSKGGNDCLIA